MARVISLVITAEAPCHEKPAIKQAVTPTSN